MEKIIFILLVVLIFLPQAAWADFSAFFQYDPLFAEGNIMPGDQVSRYFQVYNSDNYERQVFLRAEDYDSSLLSGQLLMTIKAHDNGDEFFSGSLADFLAGEWIELSALAGGSEVRYDIQVVFPAESGNEFQAKNAKFDIVLKSEGDHDSCICHQGCGHPWQWRKWYYWNNVFKSWLGRFGFNQWKFG